MLRVEKKPKFPRTLTLVLRLELQKVSVGIALLTKPFHLFCIFFAAASQTVSQASTINGQYRNKLQNKAAFLSLSLKLPTTPKAVFVAELKKKIKILS